MSGVFDLILLVVIVAVIYLGSGFITGLFNKNSNGRGIFDSIFAGLFGETRLTNFQNKIKNDTFNKNAKATKEKQKKEANFNGTIDQFEKSTDPQRKVLLPRTKPNSQGIIEGVKFNPPNTIGFGIKSINMGKGLPDTPENRQIILKASTQGAKRFGRQL